MTISTFFLSTNANKEQKKKKERENIAQDFIYFEKEKIMPEKSPKKKKKGNCIEFDCNSKS